jgi:hypothetical protein
MSEDICEAKRLLPLPQLMVLFGLCEHAKKSARCPWHNDKSNSFSVWEGDNGWRFKCHAGCGDGDEIALVEIVEKLSNAEATKRFLALAGVRRETASNTKTSANGMAATAAQQFDWRACLAKFNAEHLAQLAKWRGYSLAFCSWLHEHGLVGLHENCIAFPVHAASGEVVGAHYRLQTGAWLYTKGARTAALVIGDLTDAIEVHAFESQWDAFEICDKLHAHETDGVAVIVTRGASNGALVAGRIRPDAEVFAWPQNDPENKRDAKTGKTPAETWLATVAQNARARVRAALTTSERKDVNEWGNAGAIADDYLAAKAVSKTIAERPRPLIEFRSPSQLKSFIPPPGMVLVGDCHIVRGSVFVIGGAPGVGKSRAGVALAEAGATGFDWFGLTVHRKFKTLIIQNENGEFRLSKEFADLDCEKLDPWVRVCPPPPFGLCFDREEFRAVLARAIGEFQPDVILLDPWNAAARDDKAKDYLEAFELIRCVIPAGDQAPALGIVAHTRKPKSDERASGRALLNLLAGSYVLGSVPRSVFVMQAASDDSEDRRVVWTCCKNNDGDLGARSAWERANGLFGPVPDFDWDEFDNPNKDNRVTITEKLMEGVFERGAKHLTRPEARDALIELSAGRSAAYEALKLEGRFGSHLSESNGVLSWK